MASPLFRSRLLACLLCGIAFGSPSHAQDEEDRPPIEIQNVRVGFPAGATFGGGVRGRSTEVFKAGKFTPIYADIRCNKELPAELWLTVEASDSTDLKHTYTVPLLPMSPGEVRTAAELANLPYIKPGSTLSQIRIRVESGDAGNRRVIDEPYADDPFGLDASEYVILTAGSRLPGFRLNEAGGPQGSNSGGVTLAPVDRFAHLPDQWFGYDAVDVVILPTSGWADPPVSQDAFLNDPRDTRRAALLEWVRRGGSLVVSVGRNADVLTQRAFLREFLPVELEPGRRELAGVTLNWKEPRGTSTRSHRLEFDNGDPVPLAQAAAKTDRPVRVLMTGQADGEGVPLVLQAPFGMGRVTFVAFDFDAAPFTDWDDPASFWHWLVHETGGRIPREQGNRFGDTSTSAAELRNMQANLDSFEGVPVISFGWVALFILVYILIIGPLDYLFLKKVVKRLELTWITFPLVVIVVSAAAYFTAYALKGKDLRINKIDVVDIDLRTNRAYGSTWVTVFSPRIQSYDVAVVPYPGEWTTESPEQSTKRVLTSWAGETSPGRASLFSRSYSYHVDPAAEEFANGLDGVPIQVWSTKAFTAEWSAPLPSDRPVFECDLRHPPADPSTITGTITNNLPVGELQAHLIYRNRVYELGTLPTGQATRVVMKADAPEPQQWLGGVAARLDTGRMDGFGNDTPINAGGYRLWSALFHEAGLRSNDEPMNALMRRFDQSWRLDETNADEAILVARIPTTGGAAEEITDSPISPTQLWLNAIPGSGEGREPLLGTLRQETFIRVFIPIPPAGEEPNSP